jgi:thioredoxin reductase (NADPH)
MLPETDLTISAATIVPIIGGGPAGMSCALWLHNYGLRPILIEKEAALGGMARRSPYPNEWLLGRAGETARENAAAFVHHIRRTAVETWLRATPQRVWRDGEDRFGLEIARATPQAPQSVSAPVIVIATGTTFRGEEWLDSVENARALAQKGRVHLGPPWAGEPAAALKSHVAVIGGGDNAFDVSRMLIEKGVRATLIMRSPRPRAQPRLVARLRAHEPSGKAQILAQRTVMAMQDAGAKVRLQLSGGEEIETDDVVVLFGYRPASDQSWLSGLALTTDSEGYLEVDGDMETSERGVFAVGDIVNPAHPCIATAIASGTMAAREIGRRLAGHDSA